MCDYSYILFITVHAILSIKPTVISVQVCTEGRLILEFAFDDLMRIKTWHFTIRQYRELIPRSILAMHVSVKTTTQSTSAPSQYTTAKVILKVHIC